MKKKLIVLIIIAVIFSTGCKSLTREGGLLSDAKKLADRGDYYSAALNTIESVKIDREYKDAIEFLQYIYPKANADLLQKIDKAEYSDKEFVNDDVALYYKQLLTLNNESKTIPAIFQPKTNIRIGFSYIDYSAELEEANKKAAEDHYQKGVYFMEKGGRENSKSAVKHFEVTLKYIPSYKDAKSLKEEAIEEGMQILAFLPLENRSWELSNRQFPEMIESAIISNLMNNNEVMKYTKIIDKGLQETLIEEQIGSLDTIMDDSSSLEIGKLLNANIVVTGLISSAKIEGPYTSMKEKNRMAKIRVEEPVAAGNLESAAQSLDDENTNNGFYSNEASSSSQTYTYVTRTVRAKVRIFEKKISINATVSYKAVDIETGTILTSDTIKVSLEDSCSWGEWTGDERALTWEDRTLINSYETSIDSSEEIATKAAKQAGKKIADSLAEYLD